MKAQLATRRELQGATGLGLSFAGLTRTQDIFSMAQDENEPVHQTATEHTHAEILPEDAFDLPPRVPDHTGPYDNHFAFARAQANLSGDYYWLPQDGWILICPPGEPAYPFLERLTLARVFVTPTDPSWVPDVGEHDFTMWAAGVFSGASP